jgi:hypothetical protein
MQIFREQDAADILSAVGLVKLAAKVVALKLSGSDVVHALEALESSLFSIPSLEATIGSLPSPSQNMGIRSSSDSSSTHERRNDKSDYIDDRRGSPMPSKHGSASNDSVRSGDEYESSDVDGSSVSTEIIEFQV